MTVTAADVRAVVRAPRVSLGHAWRYWLRNAAIFKHTYKLSLLAWFIEPVIYLVAMGLGLGHYLDKVRSNGRVFEYMEFIAPGLVAVSVMYGSTFETTWNAFFKMERGKVYDAAVSTPVGLEDIALGEALWATTRAMIYGAAFIIIALPFGVFHSWWGLAVPVALALVGFMFAVMGLLFTYAISMVDYLSYYWTLFLTPMFMFAGIFFPLDQLPGWLQGFSWIMPLRHGADLMRALLVEGDPAGAAGAALWIVVVSALLFAIPLNLLRRRLEN